MILLDKQLPTIPAEIATKEEAIEIIKQLEYELKHSQVPGCGLSAVQIGINKAVAIVRINNPYGENIKFNLVNPILFDGHDLIRYNEGCLSFPGKSGNTIRYGEIVVETMDEYVGLTEKVNSQRYGRIQNGTSQFTDNRRLIFCGEMDNDPNVQELEKLATICIQHEMSHLIALNFEDFIPKEIGRNELCPCGSGAKNKKCHNYSHFNDNLKKLFKPEYR